MMSCLRFTMNFDFQWPQQDIECDTVTYNVVTSPNRQKDRSG